MQHGWFLLPPTFLAFHAKYRRISDMAGLSSSSQQSAGTDRLLCQGTCGLQRGVVTVWYTRFWTELSFQICPWSAQFSSRMLWALSSDPQALFCPWPVPFLPRVCICEAPLGWNAWFRQRQPLQRGSAAPPGYRGLSAHTGHGVRLRPNQWGQRAAGWCLETKIQRFIL